MPDWPTAKLVAARGALETSQRGERSPVCSVVRAHSHFETMPVSMDEAIDFLSFVTTYTSDQISGYHL